MIDRRVLIASSLAAGLAGSALAQPDDPIGQARARLNKEGLYLPLIAAYRAEAAKAKDRYGPYAQYLEQYLAIIGDEAGAIGAGEGFAPLSDAIRARLDGTSAEDAITAIVRESRGRRVVILNEAHNVSRCRSFGSEVAVALAAEGFSLFCAETFDPTPAVRFNQRMQAREPITTDLGFYSPDPVYAEMVRTARAAGMRPVCYEQRTDQSATSGADMFQSIDAREEAEATNLATILAQNPKARALIYCGGSHGVKVPISSPRGQQTWMAAKLKAKTGLDLLSIIQPGVTNPAPRGELPIVTGIIEKFSPRRAIVVRTRDGRPYSVGGADGVDLAVYQPRLANVEGRPGWLATAPGRKRAVFALPVPPPPESLLQATLTGPANVVPSDQYPAAASAREAVFFLKPGNYEVRLETDVGRKVLGRLKV